jgi:adenylylsulfate reductase subunit A
VNYGVGRNEIVGGTVSPGYLLPIHGLQHREKIMDESVGGISADCVTHDTTTLAGPSDQSSVAHD